MVLGRRIRCDEAINCYSLLQRSKLISPVIYAVKNSPVENKEIIGTTIF